jgi:hypothetical protein
MDQKMRRDAQMGNFVGTRMGVGIELIAQELFNIRSAEAYPMAFNSDLCHDSILEPVSCMPQQDLDTG